MPRAPRWKHLTVEWSPRISRMREDLTPTTTHFVLPDLQEVISPADRSEYFTTTRPQQRIQTIACCHHTEESLVQRIRGSPPCSKFMLVGGNEKGGNTLTTAQAAKILKSETDATLWATANPNDVHSKDKVEEKIEFGITGIITQPLLASTALETLGSYQTKENNVSLVVGLALPRSARNLQFWCSLLEQPELSEDPLFRSHLAYFSQPYVTPLIWIGRELQSILTLGGCIDGIHFMPMQNTQDLRTIFRSIESEYLFD